MEDQEKKLKEQQAADNAALAQSQQEESAALGAYNQAQYNNVGDIISEIEAKQAEAKQQDAVAQKRSNAFRYISGLSDTLSGIANLVGTSFGAANQKQTYNGNMVAEKAEQARKERKIELDQISGRLDEMRARQRELKSAGSLAEAQLKAKQGREQLALKQQQNALARETKWNERQQAWKEEEAARAQENLDRNFAEQQRQFDLTNERLTEQAEAENASREAIKQAELEAKAAENAAKRANDPKHQAKVLSSNIEGIRDELADKMGYKDYNEYLRYKNIDKKRGADIDGQRNKVSINIRDQRASENPEIKEFLDMLGNPEDLTEDQIRMLMGASKIFSDAVGASTVVEDTEGIAPKKEEPKTDENGKETVDY